MKLLFVLENYIPHIGGVEVVFKNLCEGLARQGHDISIVTHRMKGSSKFEIINGVKVYRVNCFSNRYLFTFLSIPKVFKLARKAELIHTTTFNGAFPAWFVSKLIGKKSVITIHEVWVGKWRKLTNMGWLNAKIHDILERMIYLLDFDKYVAVSKSTQRQLLDMGIKSSVIYNGVDYSHWDPKKYSSKKFDEFTCLFTGRPGVSKGLEYLIRAISLVKVPVKLLAIVSKDKAYFRRRRKLLRLIKKLNVNVQFIGSVPYSSLPSYVKSADCVVVPSLAEGFGFSAAEACAMGIPVVVSNTTSLPEVVSGKYVLVKPRNSLAIANGIEMVYNKKYIKEKLKKFLLKDNINNYLKIYEELI